MAAKDTAVLPKPVRNTEVYTSSRGKSTAQLIQSGRRIVRFRMPPMGHRSITHVAVAGGSHPSAFRLPDCVSMKTESACGMCFAGTPTRESTLIREAKSGGGSRSASGLRLAIRLLDRVLRWKLGIFEFAEDEACMLRIARSRSPVGFDLPDGAKIRKGDPIADLHFRNESLTGCWSGPSRFGSAVRFHRRIHTSLRLLAERIAADPALHDIQGLHARLWLHPGSRFDKYGSLCSEYGFAMSRPVRSVRQRIHDAFENLLIYGLAWTFNPCCVEKKGGLRFDRLELWMSRQEFLRRYGRAARLASGPGGRA